MGSSWRIKRVVDRKSTRLNSSHLGISYAVFCLYCDLRTRPSFPTRRSSDLTGEAVVFEIAAVRAAAVEEGSGGETEGPVEGFGIIDETGIAGSGVAVGLHFDGFFLEDKAGGRSEEHTSELQSLRHLVCRLLLVL